MSAIFNPAAQLRAEAWGDRLVADIAYAVAGVLRPDFAVRTARTAHAAWRYYARVDRRGHDMKDGQTITAPAVSDDFGPVVVDYRVIMPAPECGELGGVFVERIVLDNDSCEEFERGQDVTSGVSKREQERMAQAVEARVR